MLTNRFKATVVGASALLIAGGLVYNQSQMNREMTLLQDRVAYQEHKVTTMSISPTVAPIASPTATLKPVMPIHGVSLTPVKNGPAK